MTWTWPTRSPCFLFPKIPNSGPSGYRKNPSLSVICAAATLQACGVAWHQYCRLHAGQEVFRAGRRNRLHAVRLPRNLPFWRSKLILPACMEIRSADRVARRTAGVAREHRRQDRESSWKMLKSSLRSGHRCDHMHVFSIYELCSCTLTSDEVPGMPMLHESFVLLPSAFSLTPSPSTGAIRSAEGTWMADYQIWRSVTDHKIHVTYSKTHLRWIALSGSGNAIPAFRPVRHCRS